MIRRRVLLMGAASLPLVPGAACAAPSLSDALGRSRIVLVFAAGPNDPQLAAQRREAEQHAADWRERDLVLIVAPADGAALRRAYGAPAEGFCVVLIGKDRGAKRVSRTPIGAAELFATIDAMPMRRSEAAKRR